MTSLPLTLHGGTACHQGATIIGLSRVDAAEREGTGGGRPEDTCYPFVIFFTW